MATVLSAAALVAAGDHAWAGGLSCGATITADTKLTNAGGRRPRYQPLLIWPCGCQVGVGDRGRGAGVVGGVRGPGDRARRRRRVAVSLMMRGLATPGRWFRRRRALSRNGRGRVRVAHRRIARAGGRGPAPARAGGCGCGVSRRDGGGPEEAGEFAGDGDGGDVAGLAALAQAAVEAVQAVLGAPGDLQDVGGLAGLAVGEGGADRAARAGSARRPRPAAGARSSSRSW